MKTEILTGNKLIAEFMGMGYTPGYYNLMSPYYGFTMVNRTRTSCNADELQFHISWDWLMPVVEKIINDQSSECQFTGEGYLPKITFSMLNDSKHSFSGESETNLIEATWIGVVDFIKWYNLNK